MLLFLRRLRHIILSFCRILFEAQSFFRKQSNRNDPPDICLVNQAHRAREDIEYVLHGGCNGHSFILLQIERGKSVKYQEKLMLA